ncbi:MAG TPA: DNA repair protein RecO [Chitinophagaceae bacterium]|nr:DNA repair protein RecO [Chitinophagaceae bacterium]
MTHKTKGIVLRTVKYGETSVIVTVLTELFGLQSYIVKGVRQASKKGAAKAVYFQPAAMLQMEVYHNELKNLQFIREYEWAFLYKEIFSDVTKNAVALYMIELLLHSIKQPEGQHPLYYLAEESLQLLDESSYAFAANLSLYYTLQAAARLGFQLQGSYSSSTPVIDWSEGFFVNDIPNHQNYMAGELAQITSVINNIRLQNKLENLVLNRSRRRQLLQGYIEFLSLHIENFGELKSIDVLQEILG